MPDYQIQRQDKPFPSLAAAIALLTLTSTLWTANAQSLNWEGQTGVFVTPLAYTAASPKGGIGRPIVAYHYLNAGEVLGGFHTTSVTAGLSPLWKGGFSIDFGVAQAAGKTYGL